MIWDKLVDRCLLFTDAPGGLLKELLKEAEQELSDKLMLFESLYKITVPATNNGLGASPHDNLAEHNYAKLPPNYLQDIGVTHKGTHLRKMTEDEINRKTTGQSYTGTPTAYSISGDFIVFNTAPSAGDDFILHYKSRLTEQTSDKVLTIQHYTVTLGISNDNIYLDTQLGSALDNRKFIFENQGVTLTNGNLTYQSISAGLPDTVQSNKPGEASAANAPNRLGSKYTVSADLSTTGSLSDSLFNIYGSMGTLIDYRKIAPVIPDQFHTSLCDYAVAIANAKSAPDIYNTYWTKWMMNMDNLINESADRDLFHSIREEI